YCEVGWVEHKGFCYSFSPEVASWLDAASVCQVYGGRLVQIESQEKNDFIAAQMAHKHVEDAWIGGTCRYHPSIWEWVPSLKPIRGYLNWFKGEPNSRKSQAEQCMQIRKLHQYKWNDYPCLLLIRFICEK
ncbi:unnamed protein product, partial [Candidula unifasciata]